MHFRTNVKYMAYISDCLNEICNTNTITFGYRTHFLSQFTFKLHWAWNAFDCLLWVYGPGVMMVNIGTRVAPVNIAVSSLRNAALIERKVLQYTTFFFKKSIIVPWTKEKPNFLHCHTSLLVSQYIARIRNNTQTRTFQQYLLIIRCKRVLT